MAPMVATTPVTSPVADETAIAACIFMLNACKIGIAIVPPPVPVRAARQPMAEATPTFFAPCGGVRANTRRSLRKPS